MLKRSSVLRAAFPLGLAFIVGLASACDPDPVAPNPDPDTPPPTQEPPSNDFRA